MSYVIYNGLAYPVDRLDAAIEKYLEKYPSQRHWVENMTTRQMLIEELFLTGILTRPHRENDKGIMLYPGFIAKDILKSVLGD